jgi:hypothetical protein
MEVGFIEKDSKGMSVTVASNDFVESTTDLAVTVTMAGSGTAAGAVYRPVASIVPQLASEQPGPATLQAKPSGIKTDERGPFDCWPSLVTTINCST